MGTPVISRRSVLFAVSAAVALAGPRTPAAGTALSTALHPAGYGARADGRTDDTAAMEQCFAAARKLRRPVRLKPAAIYRVGLLNCSGIVIQGNNATLLARSDAVDAILVATTSFHVANLVLRQPAEVAIITQRVRAGLVLRTRNTWPSDTTVTNVRIHGGTHGVRIEGLHDLPSPTGTPKVYATFREVSVRGSGVGVWMSGVRSVQLLASTVARTKSDGIVVQHCDTVTVSADVIAAAGHGIVQQYSSAVTVAGCTVIRCRKSGIVVGGGNPDRQPSTRFVVEGNTTRGNGHSGITCDPTISGLEGTPIAVVGRIANNKSSSNRYHGIVITCAQGVEVLRNTCESNLMDGIAVASRDVRARKNLCRGNGWSGLSFYGGSPRPAYGQHTASGNHLPTNVRSGLHEARPGLVSTKYGNTTR